jgi:hypothetical protein
MTIYVLYRDEEKIKEIRVAKETEKRYKGDPEIMTVICDRLITNKLKKKYPVLEDMFNDSNWDSSVVGSDGRAGELIDSWTDKDHSWSIVQYA